MKRITKIEAAEPAKARKLRVAAYARVSTDSDEQLISLDAQKNHYEVLIRSRKDWEFAGLYYDEGISGTKMAKRDGLLTMLADCERGLIDYIIVKSISRFSRNTVESIETVRKLCGLGIYIFFEKENIDTGKMEGELLLSILSSFAESESRSISENETWSIQKRFRNGTYKISYPPYGYDYIDGEMVVNPEQSEIVKWIFSQVLSGSSPAHIAKELNARGIATKRGGKWTGHTVNGMIRNEKYTGDVIFQKTYSDDTFTRRRNNGERDQFFAADHHEAIISHEDFDAANDIIFRNGAEKGIYADSRKYQNRYAFSGRIICGDCGAVWKRRKIADYFGYVCTTHLDDKDSCSMKSIREDVVKAAFVTMINKLIFARDKVLLPYSNALKNEEKAEYLDVLDELEDRLEKNLQKRQQVTQLFTRGFLDPAVYAKQNDELLNVSAWLTAEKDAIIAKISGGTNQKEALEDILHYTSGASMLTEFDEDLFTRFVDRVIVYSRTEIGFCMKCGPIFRERI
ncbi:recombinase family protein [Aerococcaceae bacterium NML190073]|nr:recombinase family protein [Aerococcaceae bacterium NML190073]